MKFYSSTLWQSKSGANWKLYARESLRIRHPGRNHEGKKKNSEWKTTHADPNLALDNTQIIPSVKIPHPTKKKKKKFQRCSVQREALAGKTNERTRIQTLLHLQNSFLLSTLNIPSNIHHMICLFSARIDSLKQLLQWRDNKGKVALPQQIHKKILFL